MNGINYCQSLLGKPWVSGARGPEAFDCWGLLFDVYQKTLGITLPAYPNVDANNSLRVAQFIRKGRETWLPLAQPEHLCAVGISSGKFITHVGLWLDTDDGGVLHSASGRGVTFQSRASLAFNGFSSLTFFRYDPSSALL